MTYLSIRSIFVLLTGVLFSLGALPAGLLLPTVVRKEVFWVTMSAGAAVLSAFFVTIMINLGLSFLQPRVSLFVLVLSAGFVVLMRIAGLLAGWSRHWYPPGMCQACGYDLRETPVGSGCPECGAVAG